MARTTDHRKPPPKGDPDKRSNTAFVGMVWVSAAVIVAKFLSFLSQVILGYLLPVETYAVFGVAAATLALVGGFQNSSIAKVLIQKGKNFEKLFSVYSALAFQFGFLGALILGVIGFGMQFYYNMPLLFPVLLTMALSVPILAANTILVGDLSRSFRFRNVNQAEMLRALSYSIVLITSAWLGADVFTVAIATVVAAASAHLYLRTLAHAPPSYFKASRSEVWALFMSNRPAIIAGFLLGLSMRADYLVLGRVLDPTLLGFYTFGFMLVASLMQPISTGINQVFLPIFAKLQNSHVALSTSVDRYTLAILALASCFCLLLMGFAPWLIHVAWGGKWDGSQLVILALLLAMPFRFAAIIAGVAFEATGSWNILNVLLAIQAVLLAVLAGVGAFYGGLTGAIIGVITQRILSALMDFAAAKKLLGESLWAGLSFLCRAFLPFLLGTAVLLFGLVRSDHPAVQPGLDFALHSVVAAGLTACLMFLCNRSLRQDIRALNAELVKKLKRAA